MTTRLSRGPFAAHLAEAEARGSRRQDTLRRLTLSGRVVLFGYGGKGRDLALHIQRYHGLEVQVHDTSPLARARAQRDGFVALEQLPRCAGDQLGVILGACQAQAEQAALAGGAPVFYQEAASLFDAPHLFHRVRDFPAWTAANADALYEVYRTVHDHSRGALLGVLSFRLSLDPRDLAAIRRPVGDMWFDVPARHGRARYGTFLDVGAFDGDTLRTARAQLGVRRGIAVEANHTLIPAIEAVGADFPSGVKIVSAAAWSHRCRLHFAEVRGGMLSVTEGTDGELVAAPLDDEVNEAVDLLKMDIEGAELPALAGATRTLARAPDLAVAAYHRPEDLVTLPRFLADHGYDPETCDIHVGHYSDCLDDTILYVVRRDRQPVRAP